MIINIYKKKGEEHVEHQDMAMLANSMAPWFHERHEFTARWIQLIKSAIPATVREKLGLESVEDELKQKEHNDRMHSDEKWRARNYQSSYVDQVSGLLSEDERKEAGNVINDQTKAPLAADPKKPRQTVGRVKNKPRVRRRGSRRRRRSIYWFDFFF